MSDWQFPQDSGHTPLSEEDRHGLLLSHVATRDDLNDAEQRNITKALRRRAPSADKLLDDMYLRDLHKAMFGDTAASAPTTSLKRSDARHSLGATASTWRLTRSGAPT